MKKYIIKYFNEFNEPYNSVNNSSLCRHANYDEYEVDSLELCKDVIKNLLDAPDKELTLEDIKKDFSSAQYPITDDAAKNILRYYNGRLDIYNSALSHIAQTINGEFNVFYPIPAEYNFFTLMDNDGTEQLDAYLKVITYEDKK